jgi:hypothetical protein
MSQAEMQLNAEVVLRQIAEGIQDVLNDFQPDLGFALIVFKFNEPGVSNYISNASRSSMIKGLKETIIRLESGDDIPAAIGRVQ